MIAYTTIARGDCNAPRNARSVLADAGPLGRGRSRLERHLSTTQRHPAPSEAKSLSNGSSRLDGFERAFHEFHQRRISQSRNQGLAVAAFAAVLFVPGLWLMD